MLDCFGSKGKEGEGWFSLNRIWIQHKEGVSACVNNSCRGALPYICICQVAQPAVISRYFDRYNQVDVRIQARQYDLALKKKWVTHYGWFCLYKKNIGMTLVDCWKIEKTRCSIKQKKSIWNTLINWVRKW